MTRASGFWGLVVEPSKLYSQQVPSTFKITMASLGSNSELASTSSGKSQRTSLIFNLDGKEEFTLCSLVNEKIEQQALDLVLTEGENIAFRVDGPNAVHLTGYYINEEEDDGFINDEDEDEVYSDEAEEDSQIEYDSDLEDEDYDGTDSEEDEEDFSGSEDEEVESKPRIRVIETDEESEMEESDSQEEDSELDSEEDSEEESEQEEQVQKPVKKVKFEADEIKKAKETPKDNVKPSSPTKVTPPPAKAAQPTPADAKNTNTAANANKTASPQPQGPAPVKKTLPSGLQIEDLKLGNGAKATKGKTVLMHYKGTLTNGKVFDSSFGSKPLKFTVGKGNVIKGMDMGIEGMAVGGSRKLVIPAPLAYGNAQLDGIPRNSTLIFEIRLERVL